MLDLSLKNRSRQECFERLIMLFMCCQIVIDLLTTISVKVLQIPLSIGMFARFAFMAFGVIYVFMYGKKTMRIISGLLICFFACHLAYAVIGLKGSLFVNARYYLRSAVFPLSLMTFYTLFETTKEDKRELFWTFMKILNTLVFTVGVSFILSTITRTGFNMYGTERFRTGTSSWFLSGNEISSSMIILVTVPLLNYLKEQTRFTLATLLLQMFVIASLGTKSSLLLFIVLMGLVSLMSIVSLVKKRGKRAYFLVLLAVVCCFGIFVKQIPAVKNIMWQSDYRAYISLFSSQTEGGEVPPSIAEGHAVAVPEYNGDYIGSVKVIFSQEQMAVSGYFYPKYYDLSHPNYVSKTLVFTDNTGVQTEFPLEDTYNHNIPNDREQEISSAFSGISGIFPSSFLRIDRAYSLSMKIQVDGASLEYPLYYGTYYTQLPFEKKLAVWPDGRLWVSYNYDYNPYAENQPLDLSGLQTKVDTSFLNVWLSGRSSRLGTFVSGVNITIPKAILGTGYVANYKISSVKGLEMDFVELAISFGLIGFCLYFAVYFYCLFAGFKTLIVRHKFHAILKPIPLLMLVAIGISAVSAFAVGHTILTPSVSINVALMTVMFYFYCTHDEAQEDLKIGKEDAHEDDAAKN